MTLAKTSAAPRTRSMIVRRFGRSASTRDIPWPIASVRVGGVTIGRCEGSETEIGVTVVAGEGICAGAVVGGIGITGGPGLKSSICLSAFSLYSGLTRLPKDGGSSILRDGSNPRDDGSNGEFNDSGTMPRPSRSSDRISNLVQWQLNSPPGGDCVQIG